MARMLQSEEAARRLGVKLPTLYAYVSRGLLASYPAPGGRRSLFDVKDVERLAKRGSRDRPSEPKLAAVTTSVTQLRPDGPAYRGDPVVGLVGSHSFEEVAELLWQAPPGPWAPRHLGSPPDLAPDDLLRWAVVFCGARDELRSDVRPEAVLQAAPRLIATMADVLPVAGAREPRRDAAERGHESLAERLVDRLVSSPRASRRAALAGAIDAALVLLADHELATSTLAVRVAASTRGDLYDAVLAGFGTMAGPLHGGANILAIDLLRRAARQGVEHTVDETLRWQRALPGFGHMVYERGDPRAPVLIDRALAVASPKARDVVRELLELTQAHDLPAPNIDLGLAALVWGAGMVPESGRLLFTLARMAGWVAHYLEELDEAPLRYRARAVYASAP